MTKREQMLIKKGYGATTAEIRYRMPDCRSVFSKFVWADYDLAPEYPALFSFIADWQEAIDGPLQSVRVTQRRSDGAGRTRAVVADFALN